MLRLKRSIHGTQRGTADLHEGRSAKPTGGGRIGLIVAVVGGVLSLMGGCQEATYDSVFDLVVLDGRVIDPASDLDEVRNLGLQGEVIRAVTSDAVQGRDTIDASGLAVAPGFIDLHAHGQDDENYRIRVRDGVTTALEMELGTGDVDGFYESRGPGQVINYGVSIGHVPVRIRVMDDPGTRLPVGPAAERAASEEELDDIVARIRRGLEAGALGVGFSLQNTPAASTEEVQRVFDLAGEFGVPVHVHLRVMGDRGSESALTALEEVLIASRRSGASLHVAHVHSVGLHLTSRLLDRISEARQEGMDVTAEFYPYTAGQTSIESQFFSPGWREELGISYEDVEWPETGERLTEESFREYRARGGLAIIHMIPDEALEAAVRHPYTVIASDGVVQDGRGHPRVAGSYSRVLGIWVRERGTIDLSDAVRKASLLPAQRLETSHPSMSSKGRIQEGADADLVIFDPHTIRDRATYENPTLAPEGVRHVLVLGVPVVRDGDLIEGVRPGQPIRRRD